MAHPKFCRESIHGWLSNCEIYEFSPLKVLVIIMIIVYNTDLSVLVHDIVLYYMYPHLQQSGGRALPVTT